MTLASPTTVQYAPICHASQRGERFAAQQAQSSSIPKLDNHLRDSSGQGDNITDRNQSAKRDRSGFSSHPDHRGDLMQDHELQLLKGALRKALVSLGNNPKLRTWIGEQMGSLINVQRVFNLFQIILPSKHAERDISVLQALIRTILTLSRPSDTIIV